MTSSRFGPMMTINTVNNIVVYPGEIIVIIINTFERISIGGRERVGDPIELFRRVAI